ncbi:hypothetical protein PINS_up018933 [Pythium insidiosum]|nr:hypothetical protein PINS_up018933 [Pythium insidiosum]
MTVALAFETDDGSRVMQTQLSIETRDGLRAADADFGAFYDLERTAAQLQRGAFRNIALQFPDSLLPDAPRVQHELQQRLGAQAQRIFVLGDTSYGSCCVDEVAAQHLPTDCIVHYGRTCLRSVHRSAAVGSVPFCVTADRVWLCCCLSVQRDVQAARHLRLRQQPHGHGALRGVAAAARRRTGAVAPRRSALRAVLPLRESRGL